MTDEDAAAFCRRLHPVLLGGLTLHCRDRAVAEEVTQETLVRVWERWSTVRTSRSPEAWAWRVALNLTASRFRRRAVEQRAQARLETQAAVAASDAPPDEADRLAVRAAVADPPERQRAALVLRFYADLSIVQTAEALRCAEGTVKSLTNKAVAGLRRRLDDDTLVEVDHA
jgi:RNA polymerase sigma factor (sigma-70 family)